MNSITIGKVARQAGVGVETIRFYERRGLIDEPHRGQSGYRHYSPEIIPRIHFIRRAKELGFTLEEIKELLSLRTSSTAQCMDVRMRAKAKIVEIEEKIALLQRMRTTLGELVVACKSNKKTEPCPILGAIEKEGKS
ncbi:MAG: MerR family DNA-binding protein [Gammaproteobacteria bacterium]|nr:MerR family DNA-binding protein [Gammaproteobacteria bacterium]